MSVEMSLRSSRICSQKRENCCCTYLDLPPPNDGHPARQSRVFDPVVPQDSLIPAKRPECIHTANQTEPQPGWPPALWDFSSCLFGFGKRCRKGYEAKRWLQVSPTTVRYKEQRMMSPTTVRIRENDVSREPTREASHHHFSIFESVTKSINDLITKQRKTKWSTQSSKSWNVVVRGSPCSTSTRPLFALWTEVCREGERCMTAGGTVGRPTDGRTYVVSWAE